MIDEDDGYEVFTLEDEDGAETDFAFLGTVEIDAQDYAILCPVEQLETEDPDLDLYAFKYAETDDGVELDAVDDEALLTRIFTLAETALFGDEDGDDDWDDWEDDEDGDEGDAGE